MGNGALPNGPSYRAHPRLYLSGILQRSTKNGRYQREPDIAYLVSVRIPISRDDFGQYVPSVVA